MIPQALQTLKERIAQNSDLSPERKAELQDLVHELEEGLGSLSAEQQGAMYREVEAAAPVSSDENGALAAEANDPPAAGFVRQINESILRFETAHPKLTATTNRLADMLASVGI